MKLKKHIKTVFYVVLGNALIAFGVNAFYLPLNLASGGATGLGLLFYWLFGIDTPITVFVVNAVLLILGWIIVGKGFMISTVLGSLTYPLFLKAFQLLPPVSNLIEDSLTGSICAGLMAGIGVGLTLRVGSSSGGSDTLAVICNKLFHVPIPAVKIIADYGVMVLLFLVTSPEKIVYSIFALAVETFALNRVMVFGRSELQLLIMTEKHQEIREMLLRKLETGVTMLQGETGYRGESFQVVLCVIHKKKLYAVKERIHDIDPSAFVTVAEVKEVRGQGFSYERVASPSLPQTEFKKETYI